MMSRRKSAKRDGAHAVVPLKDLAPRRDVKGGAGRLLFGEQAPVPEGGADSARRPAKKARREKSST